MVYNFFVGYGTFGRVIYLVGGYATKNFMGATTLRASGAIFGGVWWASTIFATRFVGYLCGLGYIGVLAIGLNDGALVGIGYCVNKLVKYRFKEGARFRGTFLIVGQLVYKIFRVGAFIEWVPGIFVLEVINFTIGLWKGVV